MTIRKKALLIATLTIFGAVFSAYFLLRATLLQTFLTQEKRDVYEEASNLPNVFQQHISNFSDRFADWSSWDDSYQFVADSNPDFIQANLNEESVLGALNIQWMVFTDLSGRVIYGTFYDEHHQKKPMQGAFFDRLLSQEGPLLRGVDRLEIVSGFLMFPGGPMMVSSRPILNSKGEGPVRGTLLCGRYFDKNQLDHLMKFLGCKLQLFNSNEVGHFPSASEMLPFEVNNDSMYFRVRDVKTIDSYVLLKDLEGHPILMAQLEKPRTVYQKGVESLQSFLQALLGIGLFLMVVIALMVDRVILVRFYHLVGNIRKAQAENNAASRIEVKGKDELAQIALAINQWMETAESSQAHAMQAQKMEMVGTLAAGLAHDLNNHLTPVLGYIDLVKTELGADHPTCTVLSQAQKSTQLCVGIVERLRSITTPTFEEKQVFDLKELLDETELVIQNTISPNISLDIQYEKGLYPIFANKYGIQSMLMHLAVNAKDAMSPAGGRLSISAQNTMLDSSHVKTGFVVGGYVCVKVEDTGTGISPEDLLHIFEPFFTTKRKEKSSGLGLTSVFAIVKDTKGWIDIKSKPGVGSTFSVYLPARLEELKISIEREDIVPELPQGSETILFVDDEEFLRSLGKVFLERLGYTVILAGSGDEAVEIYQARSKEIHAVLLDWVMTHGSGQEAARKILKINPKAKIILAGGSQGGDMADEFLREGAKAAMSKPYAIIPMANTLRKVLDFRG